MAVIPETGKRIAVRDIAHRHPRIPGNRAVPREIIFI
jgi:hypothetical protein